MSVKKKVALWVFIIMVAAFAAYTFFPRSFGQMTGYSGENIPKMECRLTIDGVEQKHINLYPDEHGEEIDHIIELLQSSRYRLDMRYPFGTGSRSSDAYDGRVVYVSFPDEDNEYWKYRIRFVDAKVMAITLLDKISADEYSIYDDVFRPYDETLFNQVYEYVDKIDGVDVSSETGLPVEDVEDAE